MIVGGPLRGYTRGFRVSLDYCIRYFILGAALILGVGPFFAGWDTVGILLGLFFAMLPLFPTALAANILFARIFRFRTWRNERWRPWAAGALGVVLTTGGMVLVGIVGPRLPRFLDDFPGPSGELLYLLGWVVLFSNLALLVAWLLPSTRRKPLPGG